MSNPLEPLEPKLLKTLTLSTENLKPPGKVQRAIVGGAG